MEFFRNIANIHEKKTEFDEIFINKVEISAELVKFDQEQLDNLA